MPNMHLNFAFPKQCTGCQIYVPLLVGLFFIAPPPGCCLVFLYTPDLTPCLRHQALLSSIASTRLPQLLLALQTPYDYESIISSSFLGFQWIYIWINYCKFSVYLKFVPRWESSRAFYHSQLFQTCTSVATVWLYELTFTIEWPPFMFFPTAIFQHTFRFWFQTWKSSPRISIPIWLCGASCHQCWHCLPSDPWQIWWRWWHSGALGESKGSICWDAL